MTASYPYDHPYDAYLDLCRNPVDGIPPRVCNTTGPILSFRCTICGAPLSGDADCDDPHYGWDWKWFAFMVLRAAVNADSTTRALLGARLPQPERQRPLR